MLQSQPTEPDDQEDVSRPRGRQGGSSHTCELEPRPSPLSVCGRIGRTMQVGVVARACLPQQLEALEPLAMFQGGSGGGNAK
mmetsp:Transcript_26735/g.68528  ORF Transcript_26735/g.68528 Transcript_26735/m.68528 type:complete len:82 (-) Transcript_26735:28-273(-)